MSGAFAGYSPPGVYTETRLDPAILGLLANLRVPAVIATSEETKRVTGYDMIRGSSPSVDNKKSNEDVSGQFTGSNRDFTVTHYPIVTGDGTGTVTNNINDVEVKVNGIKVIVAKVEGSAGKITLALAPNVGDTVTCTYYFKKTDTRVLDEDLIDQVDSSATTFCTHYSPIVDGTGAGHTTTNVNHIIVKVNNSIVAVTNLNGADGRFTLAVAPTIGQTLTVTYYYNQYANTADDLPFPGLTRVLRVGYSPETSDFIEGTDFAIIGDQIQWGTGFTLIIKEHTDGTEFFDDTQITGQAVDDRIYNEDVSSQFSGSEVSFTTQYLPIVDGTGQDRPTSDPTTVIVTVNSVVVPIRCVNGETGTIELISAPSFGDLVEVTYWRSRVEDDTYSIEVVAPGAVGVGTYEITSAEDGRLGIAIPGTESVANPGFTGANWVTGPTVTKGFTIDETVTLTFTDSEHFTVTSDQVGGSTGFGKTNRTYTDGVTGLIFTLGADPLYAAADTLEIDVTKEATFVTSVVPITSVPGMRVTVNNTYLCGVGDITDLYTFDKSGNEPAVGDMYFISYEYTKTDFECKLFTKFRDLQAEYGDLTAANPMVLASYLMFLNGAIALITCQVQKATNSELASDQSYIDVLDRLKYPVAGTKPAVIFPVSTSQGVIEATAAHCSSQSSKRNRQERISVFGYALGTEPADAGNYAKSISNERMTAIYPDGAVIELVNADGSSSDYVVDGSYLAAAFVGINVSSVYDVAEPMTRKQLTGFKSLVREMDEATMDLVASKGVTIIHRQSPISVRHSMTTDMSSTLTRELNVVTTKDFIQQEARRVLDQFIGRKFVGTILNQVENTVAAMLRGAIEADIIVDMKRPSAERDAQQPDFIHVYAAYIPVVGINWIEVVFDLRLKF